MNRRVVITGMGAITPLGVDEETSWQNILAGKCGINRITALDTTDYKALNGAEVNNELLSVAMKARQINSTSDRTVDFAMAAAAEALEKSRLRNTDPAVETEMAVILGTGIGCNHSFFNAVNTYITKGVKGVRPTSVPRIMSNAISSQISMRFRLNGPNYVIISACASATTAIGVAYRMIKEGNIDMVLTGGTDAVFEPLVYAGWNQLGVISCNPVPEKSCRPFDAGRDGCVLGEGAGILILESLESAQLRNVPIRGEICGFGESSDALHITRPSPEGQARAIRNALKSADMKPASIGFINAHGTATKANDECESKSIRLAMEDETDRIPVASNKSYFGHMLGASGAVETITTVIGLEKGIVPANLNLDNPDPLCNLCFVGKEPMRIESPVAIKNSFGFGGNNAVLILRRYKE
ncbi:MAG: hypothetical protein A2283_19220 [Lentisphaerae bacterium RIFOXYA12_FULL_48_11]|nr:MAG: hypothetical protein A2283_19220 [Lentisphaerae bacterium RIFOXYA12_FULL_48_11]